MLVNTARKAGRRRPARCKARSSSRSSGARGAISSGGTSETARYCASAQETRRRESLTRRRSVPRARDLSRPRHARKKRCRWRKRYFAQMLDDAGGSVGQSHRAVRCCDRARGPGGTTRCKYPGLPRLPGARRSRAVYAQWLSVELRQHFAAVEAELRVQAQRAVVIGRLHQPYPGEAALASAIEHGEHQSAGRCRGSCTAGSTVIGPIPAIEPRSSMKLLPTILPSASATTE